MNELSLRCRLPLLLLLLAGACAHRPTPRYEHVYLMDLDTAMEETHKLLAARGFTFEPLEDGDGTLLLTTWNKPRLGLEKTGQYVRYAVVGLRLAPKQSVVRIFRMTRTGFGNDVQIRDRVERNYLEHSEWWSRPSKPKLQLTDKVGVLGGVMSGTRASEMEKELALRLESLPSVEVLSGNIALDKARKEASRDEDFYLSRWKGELEGGLPLESLCGTEIVGLRELLQPGQTLLIGEQLGTQEVPSAVGDLVCQLAQTGLPVALGLSIPSSEQEQLNHYLSSAGTPADQDALLAGRFWIRPYQDGRSSRAVLDLIDRVRALRSMGLRIELVAYDTDLENSNERDALMAGAWMERRASRPYEVFVVVSGNVHASMQRGTPWDEKYEPMGWHLAWKDPSVKALDLSHAPGTRWGCDFDREGKLDCRVYRIRPSSKVANRAGLSTSISLFPQMSSEGFHGLFYVGALTASPPATLPPTRAPASGPPPPHPSRKKNF